MKASRSLQLKEKLSSSMLGPINMVVKRFKQTRHVCRLIFGTFIYYSLNNKFWKFPYWPWIHYTSCACFYELYAPLSVFISIYVYHINVNSDNQWIVFKLKLLSGSAVILQLLRMVQKKLISREPRNFFKCLLMARLMWINSKMWPSILNLQHL